MKQLKSRKSQFGRSKLHYLNPIPRKRRIFGKISIVTILSLIAGFFGQGFLATVVDVLEPVYDPTLGVFGDYVKAKNCEGWLKSLCASEKLIVPSPTPNLPPLTTVTPPPNILVHPTCDAEIAPPCIHVSKDGDTLYHLAGSYYGNQGYGDELCRANYARLKERYDELGEEWKEVYTTVCSYLPTEFEVFIPTLADIRSQMYQTFGDELLRCYFAQEILCEMAKLRNHYGVLLLLESQNSNVLR